MLLACSGAAERPDAGQAGDFRAAADCISSGTVRDYQVLDDSNLIVTGTGRQTYHVTLTRRAVGLRSAWKLGFVSRTGQICGGFGNVVVDDGFGPETIRIAGIRRLTPEEHDALLVRFGKKEPEPEQAPPSREVEGAAVEELD